MAPALIESPVNEAESSLCRPKLYILDKLHPEAISYAQELFNAVLPSDPEIQNWKENAELLVVRSSYITAEQIGAAKRLKAIGKQGVGLDKIDLTACGRHGVKVFNTPGVNANSVAELVLALTMAVARELGAIQLRQQRGETVPKETCRGQTIRGKTVGLIGMGNISSAVAKMFHAAFDACIVAYDPFLPINAWGDIPHVRAKTIEEVLRSADILSLHVPLTPETRDAIGTREMRLMKPTSIIINAARGGIVNEEDLVAALNEGTIWGAGLDCHVEEPPSLPRYERLWSHPRVISTPHIGAATSETQRDTAKAAIKHLFDFVS